MSKSKDKNKFLAAISTDSRPRPTTRKTKAAAEAVQLAAVSADNSAATSSSTTVTAVAATTSPVLPPSPISPVAVDHPPAPSKPPLERAGRTTQSKQLQAEALRAKKEFLSSSRVRVDDADSFDALAVVFGDVLKWLHSSGAITQEFWKVLSAIQERLVNHVTIVRESETTSSFSALLLQTVTPSLKQLSEKSEAQHKAITSLSKELASIKTEKALSYAAVAAAAAAKSPAPSVPKPKPPPLPSPSDERILVRFDGDVPSLFSAPYSEIVATVNKHLVSLSLPSVLYATKQNDSSIFLVPASAADTQVLDKEWSRWGPTIFPGSRIAPVALHSHLQVNGILFRDVTDMRELKREFELRNPDLGPVTGLPTWVNRPPSEAQAAAISASGRKPKLAGSVYFLLQSRDKVDLALSRGRIVLCSTSPTVARGFPHLRISQCWGCYKYGHTKARCNVKTPSCAVCAKPVGDHSPTTPCSGPVACLNCGGKHRADSYSCPKRKELLVTLAGRMKDLHESLDKSSIHPLPFIQQLAH
ncbi:hypothetical protein R3P38DRAFT_2911685, partial [Favolaschia claudopus]